MDWNCITPGAIQDWELDACADGEAPPHVVEHLKRCPACRTRLAKQVTLERRLRQALYRFDCPSPDLLRDYHWGFLPTDEHRQTEAHLETCPHCSAELANLARFVPTEPPEPSSTLLDQAQRVAQRVPLVVAQLYAPRLSPMPVRRGASRGSTRDVLLFDAEDVALSVNLEQEETGTYTLFGQVLSSEPIAFAESYARLTAHEEGIEPVQVSLDANGVFTLPDLRTGVYQLVVCLPNRRIAVPVLTLEAEP